MLSRVFLADVPNTRISVRTYALAHSLTRARASAYGVLINLVEGKERRGYRQERNVKEETSGERNNAYHHTRRERRHRLRRFDRFINVRRDSEPHRTSFRGVPRIANCRNFRLYKETSVIDCERAITCRGCLGISIGRALVGVWIC